MEKELFMKMEVLSMLPLTVMSLLFGVFVFLSFFVLFGIKGRGSKALRITTVSLTFFSLILLFTLFLYIKPYRQVQKYMGPGVRDYAPGSLTYHYYSNGEKRGYRNGYFLDDMEKNPFYSKEEIILPVEYLGKKDNGEYWFCYGDMNFFSDQVEFSGDDAELLSYEFHLIDPGYKDLGFIEKTGPYFRKITVPEAQKNHIASEEIKGKYLRRSFSHIIFP
ncbi:MAG: hypothetical protein Q4P28_03705 [Tissierellia bacterium]|nr:hypothetical protein [Tissierellia bacterium]